MSLLAYAACVWPLLAALLALRLQEKVGRSAVFGPFSLLLALLLSVLPLFGRGVLHLPAAAPWRVDGLALCLPPLLAFACLLRLPSRDGVRGSRRLAGTLLLLGGAILSLSSDRVIVAMAGLGFGLGGLSLISRRLETGGAVALAVAAAGSIVLSTGLAIDSGASWSGLAAHGTLLMPDVRLAGRDLADLALLLLCWEATQPDCWSESGWRGPVLLGVPAAALVLRLHGLDGAPDRALVVGALLVLALSVLLLPAERRPGARIMLATRIQLAVGLLGVQLGGPAGSTGALVLLGTLPLLLPLLSRPRTMLGLLILAGLPPFGLFAADLLLLLRLLAASPLAGLLALGALAAAALGLLPALQDRDEAASQAPAEGVLLGRVVVLPRALAVLLLLASGLALPGPASDWLLAAASDAAGPARPAGEATR